MHICMYVHYSHLQFTLFMSMVHAFRKIRELHRITDRVVHRNGQTSLTDTSSRPHRKKEEDANKKEHVANETESQQHRVNEVTHEQREHDLGSNEASIDLGEMGVLSNGDAVDPFEFRETTEEASNVWEKDNEPEKQSEERGVRREQQDLEEESDSFSQSTSHSSSPLLEKSKRVSVHREFDADYQPPAGLEANNVSSKHCMIVCCVVWSTN